MMDVPADDTLDIVPNRLLGERFLEVADEIDRVLHLELGPGREGPIGKAQSAAHHVEIGVGPQRGLVGPVAEKRQPARMPHHDVEFVAMGDEGAFAIRGCVDGVAHHLDAAERHAHVIAGEFVVVAGDVDHPGALADLAQQFLDDVVVRLGQYQPVFRRHPSMMSPTR